MTTAVPPTVDHQALIEERDLLLRQLDQLDEEHEAGDISDTDYQVLVDGYTARTAVVLKLLSSPPSTARKPAAPSKKAAAPISKSSTAGAAKQATASGDTGAGSRAWLRTAVTVVALAVFAVGAGFALAQASGERGIDGQLTGGIDTADRSALEGPGPDELTPVATCQQLVSGSGSDLVDAVECLDEVLTDEPDNPEAMTYMGWYLLLASGVLAPEDGPRLDEADELELAGFSFLSRAIEIAPGFADPLAFRAILYDRLGESEFACADVATMRALNPPEFFLNQTAALAARNGCP